MKIVKYKGKRYEIKKSDRTNKQLKVKTPTGKTVYFGDPKMPEFPGTKRGDRYCARSKGLGNLNNPNSANFWSRRYLWNCDGTKSKNKLSEAALK